MLIIIIIIVHFLKHFKRTFIYLLFIHFICKIWKITRTRTSNFGGWEASPSFLTFFSVCVAEKRRKSEALKQAKVRFRCVLAMPGGATVCSGHRFLCLVPHSSRPRLSNPTRLRPVPVQLRSIFVSNAHTKLFGSKLSLIPRAVDSSTAQSSVVSDDGFSVSKVGLFVPRSNRFSFSYLNQWTEPQ